MMPLSLLRLPSLLRGLASSTHALATPYSSAEYNFTLNLLGQPCSWLGGTAHLSSVLPFSTSASSHRSQSPTGGGGGGAPGKKQKGPAAAHLPGTSSAASAKQPGDGGESSVSARSVKASSPALVCKVPRAGAGKKEVPEVRSMKKQLRTLRRTVLQQDMQRAQDVYTASPRPEKLVTLEKLGFKLGTTYHSMILEQLQEAVAGKEIQPRDIVARSYYLGK